jgi:hypothetical protein
LNTRVTTGFVVIVIFVRVVGPFLLHRVDIAEDNFFNFGTFGIRERFTRGENGFEFLQAIGGGPVWCREFDFELDKETTLVVGALVTES